MRIDQLPFTVPAHQQGAVQHLLDAAAAAAAELDAKERDAHVGVQELFDLLRARTRLETIALAESLWQTRQ